MQLRFGLPFALSVIALTGCSSLAWNNGTLDYKDTAKVEPLKYPEGSMVRPVTPLYPAPTVDPLAVENAPKFENARGNRFQLARANTEVQTTTTTITSETANLGRPQLLSDGNQNPLLQIQGSPAEVWQYTVATLSILNYKVLSQSNYQANIQVDNKTYVLKLNTVGTSNHLALYNPDNSFVAPSEAADLLAQIYQNWPA